MPNANALNSFMMNATRSHGPALAGFVIVWVGEAACFALNATSYLAVLLAQAALRVRPAGDASKHALRALREGLGYTFGHRDIRLFLLLVAAVSFLINPYVVMMPLYARNIFDVDARTLGLLISSAGAGTLGASLFLASQRGIYGMAYGVTRAATLAGAALALSLSTPGTPWPIRFWRCWAFAWSWSRPAATPCCRAGCGTTCAAGSWPPSPWPFSASPHWAAGGGQSGPRHRHAADALFLGGALTIAAGLVHARRLRQRGDGTLA